MCATLRSWILLLTGCVLVATCSPALAQERTHTINPEDYFTLNTITEVAISPEGKQVAYCLATWDKSEDNRRTDLWVVATEGSGKPTRLTFDRANDRKPKWSADGKAIYFLGSRKRAGESRPPFDGTTQVWHINATGGEPRPVTREAGGVSGYDYAPLADAIFFSKDADQTDQDEFSNLRALFGKAEYGHGKRKVSEIHRLDFSTWRSEKVLDEKRYVREFAATREGKRLVLVSAVDDSVIKSEGESRVDVWEGGKVTTPPTEPYRAKAASPWAWLENLCWSPDGSRFAFTAIFDAYPAEIMVGEESGGSWNVRRVRREGSGGAWEVVGYGRALGQPLLWLSPEMLGGLAERRGETGLFLASQDKATGIWSGSWNGKEGKNVVGVHRDPKSGRAAYLVSSPTHFPVLADDLGAGPPRVDPNPHVAAWKLPTVQHVAWKGTDGVSIGGVLELPHGSKPGSRLPLVVAIHGGPTTSTKTDLSFDPHNGRLYFAARGYAVLLPNYRGSTGYGDKFVTDLIGNENDLDVKDILAGIQHLVKEGIADPDRVAVMGWSNGGYLTNCLITLKSSPVKFRAASSGAGIVDTVAEWGFNDEPAYAMVFKRGLPWEQPELYRKT